MLERMYQNQLSLEAALMELTLRAEQRERWAHQAGTCQAEGKEPGLDLIFMHLRSIIRDGLRYARFRQGA
ncbi:hypothetical protein EMIT0P2_60100 [Pseudomonas sp. IT-P2]